jgi:hypothetical protein
LIDEPREPPRAVAHFALLVLIGFMVVISAALSQRPVTLASLPHIAHVADVPTHRTQEQLRWFVQSYGAWLPKTDWRPPIAAALGRNGDAPPGRLRLGYAVRVWTFLSLPMFAYKEGGYAVYLDQPGQYRALALSEEGLADLERETGRRFWAGWFFPFWRYSWGLIAVAALAGFAVLELRWQARRRAILGVM